MRILFLFVVDLLVCSSVYGRPKEDLVKHLPGLKVQLPFEMYSGYLNGTTDNNQLHYWFVEAKQNSSDAPLVLWLNGGPGCSSLIGLLTENGPVLARPGKHLAPNKFSWNRLANMIYLEAPVGVGFSYARDGNVKTDDDIVADNNYAALVNFFERFPEFKGRDFYITGESYGGVYVPTLALRVANNSEIRLKAVAVDNGLTSYVLNDNSLLYFAYHHSLFGGELWQDLVNYCCDGKLIGICLFSENTDAKCQETISMAHEVSTYGLDIYNLYGPCAGGVPQKERSSGADVEEPDPSMSPRYLATWANLFGDDRLARERWILDRSASKKAVRRPKLSRQQADRGNLFRSVKAPNNFGGKLDIPCSDDSALTDYLHDGAVREALHIPAAVADWETCSSDVYTPYGRVYRDLSPQYKELLQRKIRTHIFNGDVDMACNALGDEWFVDNLGVPLTRARQPWFFNASDGTRQVGGYTKTVTLRQTGTNLTFQTVRGAGHMVPHDKPIPAFTIFRQVLFPP